MRKFLKIGLLALSSVFLLFSCDTEDKNEGTGIDIAEQFKSVSLQGTESKKISFTAYADWTAEIVYPANTLQWATISSEGGEAGEIELTISSTQHNFTGAQRECSVVITVSGDESTTSITVSQSITEAKTLKSIRVKDSFDGETHTFDLEYDSEGRLSHFIDEITYDDDNKSITVVNDKGDGDTIEYRIENGRATTYTSDKIEAGTFTYSPAGELLRQHETRPGLYDLDKQYVWEDGNIVEGKYVWGDGDAGSYLYEYGDGRALNAFKNINLWQQLFAEGNTIMLIGYTGKNSLLMPTKELAPNGAVSRTMTYTIGADGFITSITMAWSDSDKDYIYFTYE